MCARCPTDVAKHSFEGAQAADLEHGPTSRCAQRASKPADSSNPRKGHISTDWKVCVSRKEIRTSNLDVD